MVHECMLVSGWELYICWATQRHCRRIQFTQGPPRGRTHVQISARQWSRDCAQGYAKWSPSCLVSSTKSFHYLSSLENLLTLFSASHDILRLYDLQHEQSSRHSTVPFLIIPGHRTGTISQLYIDNACRFMISTSGNRGWEGNTTEVLLGYEIGVPQ